ncbi:hypothetical protein LUZ60_010667 [Juncus effusus]|nr:hypothetical protein LUZ60_010667 [Juncus effusus]
MESLNEIEDRLLVGQDVELNANDGNAEPKHQTGAWRACSLILCMDFCEYLAYFGIVRNLVTYLTKELHETNLEAARRVSMWSGTCFLTPLLGAFLSDSYWGNYRTIITFGAIYFIGMITLTLSTLSPNEFDSTEKSSTKSVMLFAALYIIALGSGGIKPCVSSFGASQFDETDPKEKAQKGSFFNWYLFLMKISSILSTTFIVWIQDNLGWGLGFTIPTIFVGFAIASFVSGSKIYRLTRNNGGSPLMRICQVIVAAIRKSDLTLPSNSSLLYEIAYDSSASKESRKLQLQHSPDLQFLDKAAIISSTDISCGDKINPWRVCTITQVEELKILIRMIPILATVILNSVVGAQISTTFVEQGMIMKNSIGSFVIPPASLSSFEVVTVLVGIPLYDVFLIPIVRKFTANNRGISQLQRITIGLFMSTLSMISAALVESKRLEIAREYDLIHQNVEVPMSILWLVPQYVFFGASEVFCFVGQLEFFYDQAPDTMRSICLSLWLVMASLGNYLTSFLLMVIALVTTTKGCPGWIPSNLNEGHLDRFFWLLACISSSNIMLFVCCAARYKWKRAF